MAKKVLRFDDDDDYGFLLLGISSTFRDFRICREINLALDIRLERGEDYAVFDPKREEDLTFPYYGWWNDTEDSYHIIGNKSERGLLIPEQRSLDFFLIIKPGQSEFNAADVAKTLKNIRLIQAVFVLDPVKLKSKENLVF